jgi:hypothetical protein
MNSALHIIAVSFLLYACGEPGASQMTMGSDTVHHAADEYPRPENVPRSCDSCNWKITEIDFVDAIPTDTFRITQPTVIEFFTLTRDQAGSIHCPIIIKRITA